MHLSGGADIRYKFSVTQLSRRRFDRLRLRCKYRYIQSSKKKTLARIEPTHPRSDRVIIHVHNGSLKLCYVYTVTYAHSGLLSLDDIIASVSRRQWYFVNLKGRCLVWYLPILS